MALKIIEHVPPPKPRRLISIPETNARLSISDGARRWLIDNGPEDEVSALIEQRIAQRDADVANGVKPKPAFPGRWAKALPDALKTEAAE